MKLNSCIKITSVPVQKQVGVKDCGLFALAFATLLAFRKTPPHYVPLNYFDQTDGGILSEEGFFLKASNVVNARANKPQSFTPTSFGTGTDVTFISLNFGFRI